MELVKRFGGWKSEAVRAYLYSDLHGGQSHASHMLRSKPALQPQQRSRSSPPPGREPGERAGRDRDCRAGDLDVVSGSSLLSFSGVVLSCLTVGSHTIHHDCMNFCKQGYGRKSPDFRSARINFHGCVCSSVASCAGCACGALTCNARSHFRIGCSTPSVQAPLTSFRVAPTFAAMANNRDAAPPDPWTERRMKDWLLEGHNA